MKNISNYNAEKYKVGYDGSNYNEGSVYNYKQVKDGIYSMFDDWEGNDFYVTSFSFGQESDLDEGDSPKNISQYPLEDILDKYGVWVSDHYEDINNNSDKLCYLEFASHELKDIESLRELIGKHVYSKTEGDYVKLIIE